ncbi:MAG: hypothetical protein ACR2NN_00065 [Bryobacteraceae bacterium]
MNPAIFDKPFFEVTLPLMVTILISVWAAVSTNNRRLDDMNRRLDDMNRRLDEMKSDTNRRFEEMLKRLEKIDARLDRMDARLERIELDHGTRLTKLEERAWR